ncbi:hypothetical protein BDV93DRAFT_606992 [Ceratobasidium sp. AG-I]|nr:hypothetical protein BDV93DRAFT_606992 [Ceratobasidium sp. AG-I]
MAPQGNPLANALAVEPHTHSDGQENGETESSGTYVPPHKLRKTSAGQALSTRTGRRKGPSGMILTIPLDIFAQIALHLMPVDILHLARTCKTFRVLLMQSSAGHIWRGASRKVEGLPPCPPHLCEPEYIALIYSKSCTFCGATVFRLADSNLYVRLCGSCRISNLVAREDVMEELRELVLFSSTIAPLQDKVLTADAYCLYSDLTYVEEGYNALPKETPEDEEQVQVWSKAQKERCEEVAKHSKLFSEFLLEMDRQRQEEIRKLKEVWRFNVETRLLEMGWEEGDLKMTRKWKEWRALVEQPKKLTERIWKGLYPQMEPLLQENRECRLAREKEVRRKSRAEKFNSMWSSSKRNAVPYLKLGEPDEAELPMMHEILQPYPETLIALEWPVIAEIMEMDITPVEMRRKLVESKAEIHNAVRVWRTEFETELAEVLKGQSGFESDLVIKTEPMDELGPLPEFSDTMSADVRLLLRADSIFKAGESSTLLFYPRVALDLPVRGEAVIKDSWSINTVKAYSHARRVAQALLGCLEMPNATYLSVRSLGRRFICGRCHDRDPKNWDQMIQHYLRHRNLWYESEDHIERVEARGITFNFIHGFDFETTRPFVRLISQAQAEHCKLPANVDNDEYMCLLCSVYGSFNLKQVRSHVRTVHEETIPELGEDYEDKESYLVRQAEEEEEKEEKGCVTSDLNMAFLMCTAIIAMSRY